MAFLGSEILKQLINDSKVIEPADPQRIICGAYELSLGEEVFRTDSKDRKKEFLKDPKDTITIKPGQFALLLTHETIDVPINKIAFISIKAGIKLRGLVNVSGFHVDPGFKGKLVFSVYNAGSGPITLERSKPCFLIWFAELLLMNNEETSYREGKHVHKNQNSIDPTYIDSLNSGELASPNVLLDRINENFKNLDSRITARDYIIKVVLGVLVVISLKIAFDLTSYCIGNKDGYNRRGKEIEIDSTINKLLSEKKNLMDEIDSLEKLKRDTINNKSR